MEASVQQTARHWDEQERWDVGRGIAWQELDAIQQRMNRRVSGAAHRNWVAYTLEKHLRGHVPIAKCLSLCCGQGEFERHLADQRAFKHCDAVDISPQSLRVARRKAAAEGLTGIHYRRCDVNAIELEPAQYDVVWSNAAMHHVSKLEHVSAQLRRALKPDGLLVLNEYVGAARFQFSARQQEIIQACYRMLPQAYRQTVPNAQAPTLSNLLNSRPRWAWSQLRTKLREGQVLAAIVRRVKAVGARWCGMPGATQKALPTASGVAAWDPSEAVRSDEIMRVLKEHFIVIDYKPLGGSILQFLLQGIAGNFQTRPGGASWLRLLFDLEDALMQMGEIGSDFAYVAARPKP